MKVVLIMMNYQILNYYLIRKRAVEFNIPLIALNSLLCIFKSHKCFNSLPKDSRTLMHTITAIDHSRLHIFEPGTYYHFGITNGLLQNIQKSQSDGGHINIVVGVDGLPLFKSSPKQFWPILAYLRPDSDKVFPIGIYCGQEKPGSCNIFLNKFIEEAKALVENGLNIDNKLYKVSFNTFVCDAPAKSFLHNIKGHSGFYSCTRREQDGEYRLNHVCFPYITPSNRPPKRTHDNYVNRSNEEHHIGNISMLYTIPDLNIITSFPLDYMHLVYLGTVKKLILLWIKCPIRVKYPSWKIKKISVLLERLKVNTPSEIARKPRGFDQISRWKATEFRTFLLYIGPIVLKPILSNEQWNHFLNLSISFLILLSPNCSHLISIAQKLLDNFVKQFEIQYGRHFMSHNIHGLLHISDDYNSFGPLDKCSAYPFENFMSILKKKLRNHISH